MPLVSVTSNHHFLKLVSNSPGGLLDSQKFTEQLLPRTLSSISQAHPLPLVQKIAHDRHLHAQLFLLPPSEQQEEEELVRSVVVLESFQGNVLADVYRLCHSEGHHLYLTIAGLNVTLVVSPSFTGSINIHDPLTSSGRVGLTSKVVYSQTFVHRMQAGAIKINGSTGGGHEDEDTAKQEDVVDIICPGRIALGVRDESRPRPVWEFVSDLKKVKAQRRGVRG